VMPFNTLRLRIKGPVTLWSSCLNLISQNQALFRLTNTSLCTVGTERHHVGKAVSVFCLLQDAGQQIVVLYRVNVDKGQSVATVFLYVARGDVIYL
jgi:hypothetical protein